MKVGDYIRFGYHTLVLIEKVNKIEYEEKENKNYYITENDFCADKEHIIKSSSNIIDLIEVGDYVNGYRVSCISELTKNIYTDDTKIVFKEENIKSIVTKEMFSQMEYKIGG